MRTSRCKWGGESAGFAGVMLAEEENFYCLGLYLSRKCVASSKVLAYIDT